MGHDCLLKFVKLIWQIQLKCSTHPQRLHSSFIALIKRIVEIREWHSFLINTSVTWEYIGSGRVNVNQTFHKQQIVFFVRSFRHLIFGTSFDIFRTKPICRQIAACAIHYALLDKSNTKFTRSVHKSHFDNIQNIYIQYVLVYIGALNLMDVIYRELGGNFRNLFQLHIEAQITTTTTNVKLQQPK